MMSEKIAPGTRVPLLTAGLFLAAGIFCLWLTRHAAINDFGNYYYGSRLLLNGEFSPELYSSIHWFNQKVAHYHEPGFFGNYIPVPPFSLLAYVPFCLAGSLSAKLLFNLFSLLLFCTSFYRLLCRLKPGWYAVFLPLVFAYPLLNNIVQGQAYLLILSLLTESFLCHERGRTIPAALLLALCISLKLFPAFVLLYFLVRKDYRLLGWTVGFTAALCLLPALAIGWHTVSDYYTHIVPRLFNNDVIGPYYPGNQSVYTALLNLFSYDALHNPQPLTDNKWPVLVINSLTMALILALCITSVKQDAFSGFATVLAGSLLIAKYTTSYSLIFLLPLGLRLLRLRRSHMVFFLLVLALAVSMPVAKLIHAPFVLRYSRLLLLLIVFTGSALYTSKKMNLRLFGLLCLLFFVINYVSLPERRSDYFYIQNTRGILYDVQLHGEFLLLKSTLGSRDTVELFELKVKAQELPEPEIKREIAGYNGRSTTASFGIRQKPFVYNDSIVVVMSDRNQAVGFYKLQTFPLRPAADRP